MGIKPGIRMAIEGYWKGTRMVWEEHSNGHQMGIRRVIDRYTEGIRRVPEGY